MRPVASWLALACLFGLVPATAAVAAAPGHTIELNEQAPAGGPEDLALRHFKQSVEAATHGDVTVDIHMGGGLGNPQTSVENMMFDDLDMFSSNLTAYLPLMIDEVSGLSTPFLIPGVHPARRYLATPLLDEAREKVLHSRRVRFLEMSAIRQPFHLISARRPVATVDDLNGLRMTSVTPLSKSAVRLWAALGVTYVPPMSAAEMTTAFRAGRLDAILVSDVRQVDQGRLETLAPYLTGVDDCPQVWEISINETVWTRLSAGEQAALQGAANESAGVFEQEASREFRQDVDRLTARTHTRFVELDAPAIRRRLLPTYDALVAEGALNPKVLAAANAAMTPPR